MLRAYLIILPALVICTAPALAESRPRLAPEMGLTERVAGNHQTGLAIGGYDPVSYVTGGVPIIGRPIHEAEWSGSTWRFASAANRAIFLDDPGRYAPRLGGYDPIGVMEGRAAAGNPLTFRLRADGLYLFATPENLAIFTDAYEFHELQNAWLAIRERLAP